MPSWRCKNVLPSKRKDTAQLLCDCDVARTDWLPEYLRAFWNVACPSVPRAVIRRQVPSGKLSDPYAVVISNALSAYKS